MKIKDILSSNPLKVFIASSWKGDLTEETEVVEKEIRKLSFIPITGNGGSTYSVTTHSRMKVSQSDIVIIIVGKVYSNTVELECREALGNDIPVLAFIKQNINISEKLDDFIAFLRKNVVFSRFSSLQELKKRVNENIINTISKAFRGYHKLYDKIFDWLDDFTIPLTKNMLDRLKEKYNNKPNNRNE